jgi:hypothetical protein
MIGHINAIRILWHSTRSSGSSDRWRRYILPMNFRLDICGSGRDLKEEFTSMNDHLQNVEYFDVETYPNIMQGVVMRLTGTLNLFGGDQITNLRESKIGKPQSKLWGIGAISYPVPNTTNRRENRRQWGSA